MKTLTRRRYYNKKKIGILTCLMLICAIVLSGCGDSKPSPSEGSTQVKKQEEGTETAGETFDSVTLNGMASDLLDQMTLEEKVGQIFIVYTDSLDYDADTAITDEMKERLAAYQPGGILYFSFNLEDREQTKKFLTDANACSKIPLFLAVDEEGGAVARIANSDKMGTTRFPDMFEIGQTGDTAKAFEVGDTIGKEIKELGFNLDFAPVADITTNKDNTEIGTRSFGSDAKLVASMVTEVVKGLQSNDVCATLKHFPGQGDLGDDTHKGYVDLKRNIDDLRKTEFLPFKAGIKADTDFVMVSHESVETLTSSTVPASMSDLVVTEILKNELHFDKLVITDAMNMKIITKFYDSDEASVAAFHAGCDIILMPDDFDMAYDGVLRAVKDGTISEKRLDESVKKILKVKLQRGIINVNPEDLLAE